MLVKAFYDLPPFISQVDGVAVKSSNTVMHTVKDLSPGVISKYKIQ